MTGQEKLTALHNRVFDEMVKPNLDYAPRRDLLRNLAVRDDNYKQFLIQVDHYIDVDRVALDIPSMYMPRKRAAILQWDQVGGRMTNPEFQRDVATVAASNVKHFSPEAAATQTQTTTVTKEITMSIANNNVAFKSITINYVHGTDAKQLSDDQLIGAIKGLEAEIKDLGTVETKSAKIDAKVKELNTMKDAIVKLLDSRE